jgi:nucleoid DNA-binding protein
MDLNLLSRILQELILDNDRISLPGLGTFTVDSIPAYFSEDGNTIYPPNKRVSFKKEDTQDDMLLIRRYRKEVGTTLEIARKDVKAILSEIDANLSQGLAVEFPGFGKIRSTQEGNCFFVAEKNIGLFAEDLGFEPISLKVLNENPEQVLDISEDISSIINEGESLGVVPVVEGDPETDMSDIPMVEPVILAEEEDPVIMERRKRIIIILSIVNVLLVLAVLFLIFKEPIMGLFEGMMYSEEEMQILKQNGLM